MSDKVNIVLVDPVEGEHPGAWADNLVDPLAVPEDVAPLLLRHHNLALLRNCLLVARNAHDQVHVGEELLGLFEHACVAYVIHVEDAVSVDSDRLVWVITDAILALWLLLLRLIIKTDASLTDL